MSDTTEGPVSTVTETIATDITTDSITETTEEAPSTVTEVTETTEEFPTTVTEVTKTTQAEVPTGTTGGESKTTNDIEESTTPSGETTPDPVSEVHCNHFIIH